MPFQQLTGKAISLGRGRKGSAKRSAKGGARLTFENLEPRRLMTCNAVLDFDGAFVTKELLESVGWAESDLHGMPAPTDRSTNAFHDLFNRVPGTDYQRAAAAAIRQITEIVRQDFAPYDLQITVANSDANGHRLVRDYIPGDVIVIVTGGERGQDEPSGTTGRAGEEFGSGRREVDEGNRSDNIVYVYGAEILRRVPSRSLDLLPRYVAQAISHQMGHAFGLHDTINADRVISEDIMSREYSPAHSFLDVNHRSEQWRIDWDRIEVEFEGHIYADPYDAYWPFDWDRYYITENSHQYLTDVIGTSTDSWAAVLKPGELLVHGNDMDNQISVTPRSDGTWIVSLGSSFTSQYVGWAYAESFLVTHPGQQPTTRSINPFDAEGDRAIRTIRIYGKDGADDIEVSPSISARLYGYGGAGSDVIGGGSGHDYLFGGSGADFLYGRAGVDRLYGGSENDYLFGGTGNDYLYGEGGADRLYGMEGADTLRGGYLSSLLDYAPDVLNGGYVGADSGGRRPDYQITWGADPYVDEFYSVMGEDSVTDQRSNDVLVPIWTPWAMYASIWK